MWSKQRIVVALIAGLVVSTTARAESSGDRLHRGVYQEETVGDLEAAMKIYEQIVADEKANRPHVAQAKYRLGMCYRKKGQIDEAIKIFETLIEEFPGQANLLEHAQGQLATLGYLPESDEVGVQLQNVWAYSGLGELNVLAISRDGRYCAFVDEETGGLMVRDMTADKDQPVAENAPGISSSTNWQRASISPDNQWVAYIGRDSDSEVRNELRIAATDGSGDRVLYPNDEKSYIRDLGWSADSQHVLATFCDTGGETANLNDVSVRIATVSLSDGSTNLLKILAPEENDGPEPVFSPDGRYVAYARMMDTASEQEDVFLIPMDGSPEIRLTDESGDDDVLGWTPDGRGLLVRSDRGGSGDDAWLFRLVDGKPVGNARLVTPGIGADLEGPVRTPTGGWAFYFRNSDSYRTVTSVYTARLDPDSGKLLTAPKPLAEATIQQMRSPDFSPDGKYLAYYVGPAPQGTGSERSWGPGNIVIYSLETDHEREIPLSPRFTDRGWWPELRWSPDSRSILARGAVETGAHGMFRVDVETGKLALVVPSPTTPRNWLARDPSMVAYDFINHGQWSTDGKSILYSRTHVDRTLPLQQRYSQVRLMARDLETGRDHVVHHHPERHGLGGFGLAVSPDGKWMVFGGGSTLSILSATGGEPRELTRLKSGLIHGSAMAWTPDSRSVLFVKGGTPNHELWRVDVEGGELQRVNDLSTGRAVRPFELRVHPAGRHIAFVAIRYVTQYQIRMMRMVLSPQWAEESCTANLKTIEAAIKRYEHDHGDVPDHLSSLYPDYLTQSSLLRCLADDEWRTRTTVNDPKMPSSYGYVRGGAARGLPVVVPPDEDMSKPDILKLRRKYYGELAGLVECWHHEPDWGRYLQLADDGKVYENSYWYYSPEEDQGLLNQLQAAMESNPATWIEDYDILTLVRMLKSARGIYPAELIKMLEANVKAHPSDAGASAKQALSELRKIRFITCSEDDASETHRGQVFLGDRRHSLKGSESQGNRAVGLRFTDIPVPQGARIKRAYVLFDQCALGSTEEDGLVFHGELATNAGPFQDVDSNITSRRKTFASIECSPRIWHPLSPNNRTSDLAPLIQEIAAQPDWREGNALVLMVSGSSKGLPASWDYEQGRVSPMLYVEVE